jgi:hypothetical protein
MREEDKRWFCNDYDKALCSYVFLMINGWRIANVSKLCEEMSLL